jgi:polysaccharide biosynthesis/export protein
MMRAGRVLSCLLCVLLAGCAGLPIAGPTTREVIAQQVENNRQRFDLVDVDRNVIRVLSDRTQASFHERFKRYGKPSAPRIGIGDSILVTIWEVSAGVQSGSSPQPSSSSAISSLALPVQTVGPDGGIAVPYAGRIHVAGRLPMQVDHTIEHRLAKTIAGAQAIVTVVHSVNDVVSVSGEGIKGARVALPANGERLLDVIAAAGGATAPVYDTYVRLSRRGVTVTIPMEGLVSQPAENIYAWPGDILTLITRRRSFIAFGATGSNARVDFPAENLSLAGAVAKAGGLVDDRADPTGVFLLRYEPRAVVRALRTPELASGPQGETPVIFRLDLRDIKGYLLAQRFPVENNDVLYVANAPLTVTQKFLTLLATVTGPVISGVTVSRAHP